MKKKAINQGTCITTVPNLKFNQTKGRGPTLLSTTRDRRAARTPAMTRALMVCVRGTHTHGQIGSNANIGGGGIRENAARTTLAYNSGGDYAA
jgi:hypothetical protein